MADMVALLDRPGRRGDRRVARRADRLQRRRGRGDDDAGVATTGRRSSSRSSFTALFIAVILDSTKSERAHGTALIAIPLTLVAIHVAAIPISGASVNPARSLGPAIVGTEFHDLWIYLIAPPIGAVLGWIAHRVVVDGRHEPAGRRATPPGEGRARLGRVGRGRPRRRAPRLRARAAPRSARPVGARRGARRPRARRRSAAAAPRPSRAPPRARPRPRGRRARRPRAARTRAGRRPCVATTDRPHAIASSVASPNGSARLGWQTTSAAGSQRGTSACGTAPARWMPARPSSAPRSGPSPTKASDPSPRRSNARARRRTFFRSVSEPTQTNAVPSGRQPSSARASPGRRARSGRGRRRSRSPRRLPRASGSDGLEPRRAASRRPRRRPPPGGP